MMDGFWWRSASRGNNVASLVEVWTEERCLPGFYGFLPQLRQQHFVLKVISKRLPRPNLCRTSLHTRVVRSC